MYRATVTKSLSDLKPLNYGPILLLSIVSAIPITYVGEKIGTEAMFYSLLLFLFFGVSWLLTGQLKWRTQRGELFLSEDQLRLKWMKNEEVTVNLMGVSLQYQLKHYHPLGILPKKPYIQLFIEGGPLGPHEFFFVHDGEYNASQWEKLGLQQIETSHVSAGV